MIAHSCMINSFHHKIGVCLCADIMVTFLEFEILFILLWGVSSSIAIPSRRMLNDDEDRDLLNSADRSQDSDDDSTMIISKLSDQELMSLLQKGSKKAIYDTIDSDSVDLSSNDKKKRNAKNKSREDGTAFFRLNDKEVEPFTSNNGADPKYLAHQKIQNLLYSRPTQNLVELSSEEIDANKELLFDILTEQLKKLCCKSRKTRQKKTNPISYEPLLNIPSSNDDKSKEILQYEQMFLIINDEIKSEEPSEVVYVDPESLDKNSSVILLGPITTALTDSQLKIVMNRITTELSKPEYIPLLQELSEGKISNRENSRLVKSLVSGSNTRRYIKPHRCRTRYPLAQGPKWLICTGYLNINTPSIYD